jgi:hypothetical protein
MGDLNNHNGDSHHDNQDFFPHIYIHVYIYIHRCSDHICIL